MKRQLVHTYNDIISIENLLAAWNEFVSGKRKRLDVLEFQGNLMSNIIALHEELRIKTYAHGPYYAFNISDPKPRNIHKARVRDRLLHHALYRKLYPFFDKTFIADSYSCRLGKGTYKALNRFRSFGNRVSKKGTKTCWVLKCDIKKFFANIDHGILLNILKQYISDTNILRLLEGVISSFQTKEGVGLPLGNLTSQLLVNIYMSEFDQFMKHRLKAQYYIRYADDFVIFSRNKEWLIQVLRYIVVFLQHRLRLEVHPDKVFLKTLASGVDFLGWVHFSDHRVLRTATRRRMERRLESNPKPEVVQSYVGLLKYGNTIKLCRQIFRFSS